MFVSETTNSGGPPRAGVDQRADVGGARGDKAIERRDDALVLFEHPQAVEVGLRGANQPLFVGGVGRALVEVLLRYRVGGDETDWPRLSVASESTELALALARFASACMICWSRSGASISARRSPL